METTEKVLQGEKATRTTLVQGELVTVTRTVKKNATDKVAKKVNWVLDFSACSHDELLEYATASGVIELQREYRDGNITESGTYTFPRPSNRKVKDPVKNAEKALSGLTKEQVQAMLAKFA